MRVVIPAKAGIQLKRLLPAGRQGIPDQACLREAASA
jgi:hypothetical protein